MKEIDLKERITSYFNGIFGSAWADDEFADITSGSIKRYIFPDLVIWIFPIKLKNKWWSCCYSHLPIRPITGLGGGGSNNEIKEWKKNELKKRRNNSFLT